jgi:hypothetical protein
MFSFNLPRCFVPRPRNLQWLAGGVASPSEYATLGFLFWHRKVSHGNFTSGSAKGPERHSLRTRCDRELSTSSLRNIFSRASGAQEESLTSRQRTCATLLFGYGPSFGRGLLRQDSPVAASATSMGTFGVCAISTMILSACLYCIFTLPSGMRTNL